MQQQPTFGRALIGSLIAIGFAALFYQGCKVSLAICQQLISMHLGLPKVSRFWCAISW